MSSVRNIIAAVNLIFQITFEKVVVNGRIIKGWIFIGRGTRNSYTRSWKRDVKRHEKDATRILQYLW